MKPTISVNHTVIASPVILNQTSPVFARVYDGEQWGAPAAATFIVGAEVADSSNLVISEIMYNPVGPSAAEIDAGFTDGDQFEYIELLNISSNPLDLNDVSFSGGIDFDFVGAVVTELPPAGRALVVRNQAAFLARYGAAAGGLIAGEFAGDTALANNGERIAIIGALGSIRDFRYNDKYPWPESPDGDGPSLVLIEPESNPDHGIGSNWKGQRWHDGQCRSRGRSAIHR